MSRELPDGLRRPPVDGVDRRDGDVVVRLAGEIDLYNAGEVGSALQEIAGSERPARVVVDLGEVEFVDSTALGALIEARKQLGETAASSSPRPDLTSAARSRSPGCSTTSTSTTPSTPRSEP